MSHEFDDPRFDWELSDAHVGLMLCVQVDGRPQFVFEGLNGDAYDLADLRGDAKRLIAQGAADTTKPGGYTLRYLVVWADPIQLSVFLTTDELFDALEEYGCISDPDKEDDE